MAPDTIRDGKGRGYLAEVDSENRLRVGSIVQDLISHANIEEYQAYSMYISVTPTGANDCFAFLKNISADSYLIVSAVKAYTASDENIQLKLKDTGTAAGGTIYVPVNRNTITSNTANVLCEYGVDITGLSGGLIVDNLFIDGATSSQRFDWNSGLVVSPNQMISFYAVAGAIALRMTVSFFFHSI